MELCYTICMKTKKENVSAHVRIYKSTHKKLKVRAAKESTTIADLIDKLTGVHG